MRRKPLGSQQPRIACWRVHGEPSRPDEGGGGIPVEGSIFLGIRASNENTVNLHTLTSRIASTQRSPLAVLDDAANYDAFRYLPISERSLFSFFFGGPLDISFNSSL